MIMQGGIVINYSRLNHPLRKSEHRFQTVDIVLNIIDAKTLLILI